MMDRWSERSVEMWELWIGSRGWEQSNGGNEDVEEIDE